MRKIHFIGIGGIGVSALAKYYLKKGWQVSGSDLSFSEITDDLKNQGARISVGKHKAKSLSKDTDLVIYSPAVSKNNLELVAAKRFGIKYLSYPQALGQLTREYYTIAVSGTHGKSTTTAMIGLLLKEAKLDPTVIVGTKVREFNNFTPHLPTSRDGAGSNCRMGESKYLVIEADEWQASFLNYSPKIIILTNIEREHLDYYKNLSHILNTYRKYLRRLSKEGILIANKDDKNVYKLAKENKKLKVIFYSLKQKETGKVKKVLKIPGTHNASNALAVLAVAKVLNISDRVFLKALSKYKGTWRRFEEKKAIIGNKKITIISDYAHHPTEIKATLAAVKEKFRKRKIFAIFQPHQYQRTFFLFDEFVKSFNLADEVILTNIFDVVGRETEKISKKVSAQELADNIKKQGKNCHFIANFRKIPQFIKKRLKSNDIVLIMGAGDIYKLYEQF